MVLKKDKNFGVKNRCQKNEKLSKDEMKICLEKYDKSIGL